MKQEVFIGMPITESTQFAYNHQRETFENSSEAMTAINRACQANEDNQAFIIGNSVDLVNQINCDKLDTENNLIITVLVERF